ncbi:MAG TPA: DUF1810 family protein [Candidatus Binatia bacterium]|nr:DUF1810 family protein [Candidatus Binatia bacterium]
MSKWNSPEWEALCSGEACPICRDGRPVGIVAELNVTSLTSRLLECAEAVLRIEGRSATEILGSPDDLKLRSCVTLFACVSPPGSVFDRLRSTMGAGETKRPSSYWALRLRAGSYPVGSFGVRAEPGGAPGRGCHIGFARHHSRTGSPGR